MDFMNRINRPYILIVILLKPEKEASTTPENAISIPSHQLCEAFVW